MREIKFRGYNKELHKWIYGYYIEVMDDSHIYDPEQSKVSVWDDDNPNIGYDMFGFFEVEPESVGQYTGLKDKNGKEIYEGDIVEFPSSLNIFIDIDYSDYKNTQPPKDIISPVYYAGGQFTFHWMYGQEGQEVGFEDVEIIGNIYENSELLKKD